MRGHVTCRRCRDHLNDYEQRKRRARKITGQCIECSASAVVGKTMCQRHLDRLSAKAEARSLKRIAAGLCIQCRRPNPEPTWRCAKCERAVQKRAKERAAEKRALAQAVTP